MIYSLEGRAALITGANQGLGLAIARAYVQAGANVMLCARNPALLAQAHSELTALAAPNQIVQVPARLAAVHGLPPHPIVNPAGILEGNVVEDQCVPRQEAGQPRRSRPEPCKLPAGGWCNICRKRGA